jgi:hypothetical protein
MADRLAIYRQIDRFDPFASFERDVKQTTPQMVPRIDMSIGRPRLVLVDEDGKQLCFTMRPLDLHRIAQSAYAALDALVDQRLTDVESLEDRIDTLEGRPEIAVP